MILAALHFTSNFYVTSSVLDYVRLAICSYHCKKLKCDLHPLNSKNNGPILLLKTICTFGHWRCFLSYVSTDGKDSKSISFKNHQKFMMVSDPWLKLFDIFVITQLQEHFVCR